MATTVSLRRLWTIYKSTAIAQGVGVSKRDLASADRPVVSAGHPA